MHSSPQPKQARGKLKPIRAKLMWAHPDRMIMCGLNYDGALRRYGCIDLSDPDALVEQVAAALGAMRGSEIPWQEDYLKATAVLRSLNLLPRPRKGR